MTRRALLGKLLLAWVLLPLIVVSRNRAGAANASVGSASRVLPWEAYAGHWVAEPGGREEMERAIGEATEPMGFIKQGIARARLRRRLAPPRWIDIGLDGEFVLIHFEGSEPHRMSRDGREALLGQLRLRVERVGERLHHVGSAPDGARENWFRLEEATARLVMDTVVTSPQLPRPVRFELSLRKAPQAPAAGGPWKESLDSN